jgi:ABC-type nitrate/sulfonate/bicarbonate transport system substrate-binding protein
MGQVIRRTGDVWKGAPGCSLTTTRAFSQASPEVVQGFVGAFARAAEFVRQDPSEAARIAADYIGLHPRFILKALQQNQPDVDAIRNVEAMRSVMTLMQKLGYVDRRPENFTDLSYLDAVQARVTP